MAETKGNIADKITEVCVYSDRAMITRSVDIDTKKGINNYIFENLPLKIITDSVRVKAVGDVVLLDNNLTEKVLEQTSSEKLNELNEKIDELFHKIREINQKIKMNGKLKTALTIATTATDISFPVDMSFNKADPMDFQISRDNFNKEIQNINSSIIGFAKQLHELEVKQEKLENEKNPISATASSRLYLCKVNYRKTGDEKITLKLVYVITGASWSPLYDARLDYKKRIFTLTRYANVKQLTGEYWQGVTLSLSTANPVIGAYLPDAEPWYLDIFIPPPPPSKPRMHSKTAGMKKMKMNREDAAPKVELPKEEEELLELDADTAGLFAPPEPEAQSFAQTEIESSGVNVTFTSNVRQNVPPDGNEKKIFVSSDEFPVKYEYIIMPGIREAAYLKIIVTNSLDYSIVKGQVKVFRDYDFVGDSEIKTVSPGQEFEIYMGVDDNFKVKRELINKFRAQKGFSGKDTKITYEYKLVIESYKEEKERVKVFERIPVSRQKEIEVELEDTGGFDFKNQDKGILVKEFDINPKEKTEITYSFSVRYPSERVVFGLD